MKTLIDKWRQHKERRAFGDGEWGHLFSPYDGDEVVSLDCETTSIDVDKAEILSIGAVRLNKRRVFSGDTLDLKMKPPKSLAGDSIKIHKIRAQDLSDGMNLEDALPQVLEFIGNRPILGYYVAFDIAMLNKYLRPQFGFGLPNKPIELSHEYRNLMQRRYADHDIDLRFETISSKLKIPTVERHSAVGDAITVGMMHLRMQRGDIPEL